MKTTILTLLFTAVALFAQDRKAIITNTNPAGQQPLSPLSQTTPSSVGGEKVCAPYFVLVTDYKGAGRHGLMFKYGASNRAVGIMGMMSYEKFTTIIDNTKQVPTVEMVSLAGVIDRNTKVIVRLSQKDYAQSKNCLPKP